MKEKTNQLVSVIILSKNEEANIQHAICSVNGWSDDVHVVDSGSTDKTIEIARNLNANIHEHKWTNWAEQRNWALATIDLKYKWVLFLDADEQLTQESRSEISQRIYLENDSIGFYIGFEYYFLGKPLLKVMKPHFRLVRKSKVKWQTVGARETCNIPDNSPHIRAKLLHKDNKGLKAWLEKQTQNAFLDAQMIYEIRKKKDIDVSSMSKFKLGYYKKCPMLLMPLISFFHKLFCSFSLKNGFTGFLYITVLSICYQLIVALRYYELNYLNNKTDRA